jgi:ribosomal protein S18 acetylase RimI-like enzyme
VVLIKPLGEDFTLGKTPGSVEPFHVSLVEPVAYQFQLNPADLPALMEVQEIVRQSLPDPDLFQCEEESYYTRAMAAGGAAFGAFDGDRMAGFGLVIFPGAHPDNLCRDLPDAAIDPREVAHLDGSAAHPAYRGHGIQRRLSELRMAYAAERGARHFLMTVSPGNPHSLRNHLNHGGFRVQALKRKYSGVWRLILYRGLESEAPAVPGPWECCRLDDLEAQRRLLAAGLVGVRLVSREDVWELRWSVAPMPP